MPAQERGPMSPTRTINKPDLSLSRARFGATERPRYVEVSIPRRKDKAPLQPNLITRDGHLFAKSADQNPTLAARADVFASHVGDLRRSRRYSPRQMDVLIGRALAHHENETQKAKEDSERDELTKLYTRKGIMRRFEGVLSRAERTGEKVSIAVMDLDKFKTINDEYGHSGGDAVLRHTANHLRNFGRGHDIWGRLGGEEFIGILPGENIQQAARAMDRQRKNLPKSVDSSLKDERKFKIDRDVTMSVGIATYDQKAYEERFGTRQEQTRKILIEKNLDLEQMTQKERSAALTKAEGIRKMNILNYLTDQADKAMYKAKDAGRNKVFAATEDPDGKEVFVDANSIDHLY